jgi:predicted  nucleic acid-binding Zn-ribbon protein
VIALLLTERRSLLLQLEAAGEDFEELRRVNIHAQDQLTRALGVADDERLSLAAELERAHDEILTLEGQLEESRVHSLEELELSQQLRDSLEFELMQLRAQR